VAGLKERLDELEKLIKALGSNSGSTDVSALLATLVKQTDFEKLRKRVEALETLGTQLSAEQKRIQEELTAVKRQTEENTREIEKLKELLKAFDAKLAKKVDREDYDKLLALIKAGYRPASLPTQPRG
jgi:DNA repair exonuclease SbcCD ATPase subunit